jgi:ParB/RepB/Spo0J family partition protein
MPQQVIDKPRSVLKPDPDNPRKQADPEYIGRLAADIKLRGVVVPLLIRPDDVIIDGWCRWLAALPAGLDTLPCIVTAQQLTPGGVLAMQLATVMHRADISGGEKWQACERLRALNPAWQQKDIASALSLSESMIVRLLSPGRCIAAAQEALLAGRIGISDCYAISKLPEDQQAGLLALKLSGASRDAIEQAGRKRRNGSTAAAVRLSRIKAVLPSGVSIVASGEALSLDDLIESLGEAQKEARRAREQGLDAKTFSAVMRDKARKG